MYNVVVTTDTLAHYSNDDICTIQSGSIYRLERDDLVSSVCLEPKQTRNESNKSNNRLMS